MSRTASHWAGPISSGCGQCRPALGGPPPASASLDAFWGWEINYAQPPHNRHLDVDVDVDVDGIPMLCACIYAAATPN
jgi:hypothetical protein